MSHDRIIFRVWIDGRLVARDVVGEGDPLSRSEALADGHQRMCIEAQERGSVWMVEIETTWEPPERRFTRFGTDKSMIVDPVTVEAGGLQSVLSRRLFGE